MIKIDKHIEIVSSTVLGLSSMSSRSRDAVYTLLCKYYTEVNISIVNNLADLNALVELGPDLVFLGMSFIPVDPKLGTKDSNRIWISEYLDEHGVNYTGSSEAPHKLERSKALAKYCAMEAGLKTSPYFIAKQNKAIDIDSISLKFPMFVKPLDRGGGLGIDCDSVVRSSDELTAKINSISINYHADSIVEEYLSGREFSVAILKKEHSEEYSIMPIELISEPNENGECLLAGKVKSANTEQAVAIQDDLIKSKVTILAFKVFKALGARDYGRIDIRMDKNGVPNFLEANLIPSLIEGYGSFPKACVINNDMDYKRMILQIVRLGLNHESDKTERLLETSLMKSSDWPIYSFIETETLVSDY